MHASYQTSKFARIVRTFLSILATFGFHADLKATANISVILAKLPPDLKEKRTFFNFERRQSEPNVAEASEWLAEVASVHNQLIAKRSHESRGATGSWKQKNQGVSKKGKVRIYATEDKRHLNKNPDQSLCCNKGICKLWNCPYFKMIIVRQRYEFLKKNGLVFGCVGKTLSVKDCKISPCGISDCDKKHNRLLHEQKGDNRTNVQQKLNNFYSMPVVVYFRL